MFTAIIASWTNGIRFAAWVGTSFLRHCVKTGPGVHSAPYLINARGRAAEAPS